MAKAKHKKKLESSALWIVYKCPDTGLEVSMSLDSDKLWWDTDVSPCEICGSHGHVKLEFDCLSCKAEHSVELRSW